MIELTKEYIDNLRNIITEKDDAKIKEILHELYPADIAELYKELDLQEAIYLYLLMDGEKAADVLMELDEEDRHKLLKELPNELIAKRFVDNMETDDAVDLMRELDEDTQEEILSHIEDVEQAGDIVDTFGHTPILVHHDHLGTHQTAGGVLVVFQQVHDITSLLYVLDMRKDLLLGILVQLTHQVNGIIRFHVIDETLGDKLIGKFLQ